LTMNRSKEEIGFALGKICGVMTTAPAETCYVPSVRGRGKYDE
jgi:hypothetical protein